MYIIYMHVHIYTYISLCQFRYLILSVCVLVNSKMLLEVL